MSTAFRGIKTSARVICNLGVAKVPSAVSLTHQLGQKSESGRCWCCMKPYLPGSLLAGSYSISRSLFLFSPLLAPFRRLRKNTSTTAGGNHARFWEHRRTSVSGRKRVWAMIYLVLCRPLRDALEQEIREKKKGSARTEYELPRGCWTITTAAHSRFLSTFDGLAPVRKFLYTWTDATVVRS
jgi:hypothetical protein